MNNDEDTGEDDLLLDTGLRLSCRQLDEYLKDPRVQAVWDTLETIDEGVLALGEFFVWLDGPKKWLHTWEQYLNEWSSCMRVEYLDEIPQDLWDAAEKYSEELDRAFEESKRKQQEERNGKEVLDDARL